jgi:hypothetical protein
MPEYRLTITVTEHGERDVAEDRMERLLEAFEATHPESGAVIGANFHLGHLDATFSVVAEDVQSAARSGSQMFADAATAAGLEPTEVIEINASSVGDQSAEEADRALAAC